jgi:hypothetical protein
LLGLILDFLGKGRGMADDPNEGETYSPEETEKRAAAALKRMLQTPHKPHKDSKKGRGTTGG